MSDIQQGFGDLGGAVSDLFGAAGSEASASAYDKAAQIAEENAALTERSTAIQAQQTQEQTTQVLGSQAAGVAAAGFSVGGSAGDLLRSSTFQAALSKQLVTSQGESTALGYTQQAQAYEGQASAAKVQAAGKGVGGIISGVASAFSFSVICTELTVQHKLPWRWWVVGQHKFVKYPDAVKEGYYMWALPTARHMKKYPDGILSRIMEEIFVPRAKFIAGRKNHRGAITHVTLWLLCYAIGFVFLSLPEAMRQDIVEAIYGR